MSEYRLKIGVFAPMGSVWSNVSGRRGRPHQPFFLLESRINDLSCGVRMWAQVYFVLSQCTRLTDGRADRRTEGLWKYRALHYIHLYTVKFTDALEVNSVTHFVIYILHTGWLLNSIEEIAKRMLQISMDAQHPHNFYHGRLSPQAPTESAPMLLVRNVEHRATEA